MLSVSRLRCLQCASSSSASAVRTFSEKKSPSTLYEDLGLTADATDHAIRQAFLERSKLYHPDSRTSDPDAAAKFQKVAEAHEVLGNPRLRRQYDLGTLGRRESAADKEASYHRFEGEAFYQSRAQARQGDKSEAVDVWLKENSAKVFYTGQIYNHGRRSGGHAASLRAASGGGGGSGGGGSRSGQVVTGQSGSGLKFFTLLLILFSVYKISTA